MKKRIINSLIIIFIAVFVFSGYKLYIMMSEYQEGKNNYQEIVKYFTSEGEEETSESTVEIPPKVDFSSLEQINSDLVGWLYQENTVINYPIVQGKDNKYYLTHLFDKTYNIAGALFLDFRCNDDYSDYNSFIYGHHLKNDTMFSCLVDYQNQEYYEEHPNLYLLTPSQNYYVELFSGYVTSADSDVFDLEFKNNEDFLEYLEKIVSKSNFTSNVMVKDVDKILTLSTCTYDYDNARYVVHGKLVPIKA